MNRGAASTDLDLPGRHCGDGRGEVQHTVGETIGQLGRDRPHSRGRHGGVAGQQAAEDHVEHPAAGLQGWIQLDAPDEGPEELLDDAVAEAIAPQRLPSREVFLAEKIGRLGPTEPPALAQETHLVGDRPHRGDSRADRGRWSSDRIADQVEATPAPHECTGLEPPQIERVDIELGVELRVFGEQDLEATVEQVAVDHIGPNPSADPIGRLEHGDVPPGAMQRRGGGEAGQARAHDRHLDSIGKHRRGHGDR